MILSLHIPKTAGTSLLKAYRKAYGDRVLYHNEFPSKVTALSRTELAARYDIVHGHLDLRGLRHLIDNETRIVTFLRNPVQRVVSSYHFHDRPGTRNPLARQVRATKMTLTDFADLPGQRDVQSAMIAPIGRHRIDFFGLSERFAESVAALSAFLGVGLDGSAEANHNPGKPVGGRYILPPEVAEFIRQRNRGDLELYAWLLEEAKGAAARRRARERVAGDE